MTDYERYWVKAGEFRIVRNAKRKRKIQKRGDAIWWSSKYNAWLWTKREL